MNPKSPSVLSLSVPAQTLFFPQNEKALATPSLIPPPMKSAIPVLLFLAESFSIHPQRHTLWNQTPTHGKPEVGITMPAALQF